MLQAGQAWQGHPRGTSQVFLDEGTGICRAVKTHGFPEVGPRQSGDSHSSGTGEWSWKPLHPSGRLGRSHSRRLGVGFKILR